MIVSLANLKTYLWITGTESDTILTTILSWVNSFIEENYWPFEVAEFTEYHNGRWTEKLQLHRSPIVSVTSIQYNTGTAWTPIWTAYDADSYVFNNSIIVAVEWTTHPRGYKNIKVVYDAGYETIPGEVIQAVYDLCAFKFNNKGSEWISSEKVDDVQITYKDDTTQSVINTLSKYQKIYV